MWVCKSGVCTKLWFRLSWHRCSATKSRDTLSAVGNHKGIHTRHGQDTSRNQTLCRSHGANAWISGKKCLGQLPNAYFARLTLFPRLRVFPGCTSMFIWAPGAPTSGKIIPEGGSSAEEIARSDAKVWEKLMNIDFTKLSGYCYWSALQWFYEKENILY